MKQYYPKRGLGTLCGLFGKSRQGFYDSSNRICNNQINEGLILEAAKDVKTTVNRNIGGAKTLMIIKPHLLQFGVKIGRDRLYKIMRVNNLLVKRKRKYAVTTNSDHPYKVYRDLTGELQITGPNQLWVSDITYLRTWKGFAYLSLITDAYSRKIVGHHLSQSLKARGSLIALEKAISTLDPDMKRPVHHSDRGIQYCCEAYVKRLKDAGIGISMTQNGSPYENALAERVNGILKSEFELNKTFRNYSGAIDPLQKAISIYNRLRPHSSIDNLTPEEAHKRTGPLKVHWKRKKARSKKRAESAPKTEALSTNKSVGRAAPQLPGRIADFSVDKEM